MPPRQKRKNPDPQEQNSSSNKIIPGQKHLIQCRCILSQFKKQKDPPLHQFVVFSSFDSSGNVISKYCQCNNCGIIHKVVDICKSEIIEKKEDMTSIVTIDDIRGSIHANLCTILDKNNADLPTWEACQHIIENSLWGSHVILTSEKDGDTRAGKYVRIIGESLFKVETFTRTEVVE